MPDFSTGIGAVGSTLGFINNRETADAATDAQRESTDASLALIRDMYEQGLALNEPFRQAELSRLNLINELFGLGPVSAGGGVGGQRPFNQFEAYVQGNDDLMQAYNELGGNSPHILNAGFDRDGDGQISRGEFGEYHYATHGQGEGRVLPTAPENSEIYTGADSQALQNQAFQRFMDSPFAAVFRSDFERDKDNVDTALESSGLQFSGARMNAVENARARNFGNQFNSYLSSLFGSPPSAATGTSINLGSNFGSQGGNLLLERGQVNAEGHLAQGANTGGLIRTFFG